jgi:hypothetical protein
VALNPEQFGPWANTGPIHARLAYESDAGGGANIRMAASLRERAQVPVPEHVHPGQGQLLDPNKVARPEPHQQTPAQFAADDRSWWHGRYAKSPRLTKGGSDEGFHAGSRGSAVKRLEANYGRRSGDAPARMFPLRMVGKTADRKLYGRGYGSGYDTGQGAAPETPAPDSQKHVGLGSSARGYFYKNEVEDAGHISVGAPRREGFLATHRDLVEHAQSEGKFVHPNVAWAAKKMPEHTGEDVMAYKRRRPGDESRQMSLDHAATNLADGVRAELRMLPSKETQRRSYNDEGGNVHHVYKLPGDTHWSPTHG